MNEQRSTPTTAPTKAKHFLIWLVVNASLWALIATGVFGTQQGSLNVLSAFIVIHFIASLFLLAKKPRDAAQKAGRSVPSWIGTTSRLLMIAALLWPGHFWLAGMLFIALVLREAILMEEPGAPA